VGFEQTTYTFAEDSGTVEVCTRFFQPSQIDSRVVVELLGTTTPDTADGEDSYTCVVSSYVSMDREVLAFYLHFVLLICSSCVAY